VDLRIKFAVGEASMTPFTVVIILNIEGALSAWLWMPSPT
jgi:hypothetical protein